MREILFRGKRKDNSEWVVGMLARYNSKFNTANMVDEFEMLVPVIPETVGQYTDLTDKNGKKIFEGDIVKIVDFQMGVVVQEGGAFGIGIKPSIDWDYLDSEICTITGCENRPYFCRNDNFCSFWELMWNYNQEENSCCVVEIIGNIHDNPELLKGGYTNGSRR